MKAAGNVGVAGALLGELFGAKTVETKAAALYLAVRIQEWRKVNGYGR